MPRVLILSTDKTRELLPSNLSSWFSYFLVDLVLTCPGLYFSTPQEKAVVRVGSFCLELRPDIKEYSEGVDCFYLKIYSSSIQVSIGIKAI